jgi:hypothetical protein
MDHIFGWVEKPKEMISETFPVRPEHFDRPISLQQGCFTFHVPESSTIPESDCPELHHTLREQESYS